MPVSSTCSHLMSSRQLSSAQQSSLSQEMGWEKEYHDWRGKGIDGQILDPITLPKSTKTCTGRGLCLLAACAIWAATSDPHLLLPHDPICDGGGWRGGGMGGAGHSEVEIIDRVWILRSAECRGGPYSPFTLNEYHFGPLGPSEGGWKEDARTAHPPLETCKISLPFSRIGKSEEPKRRSGDTQPGGHGDGLSNRAAAGGSQQRPAPVLDKAATRSSSQLQPAAGIERGRPACTYTHGDGSYFMRRARLGESYVSGVGVCG